MVGEACAGSRLRPEGPAGNAIHDGRHAEEPRAARRLEPRKAVRRVVRDAASRLLSMTQVLEWHVRAGAIALALAGTAGLSPALAQAGPPPGILAPGNAAVTGFSGAKAPQPGEPGANPDDKTFIDLEGPSARVVDLQDMRGPPAAQLVPAPKPFTATAAQIGQVFAVALDGASPPNIYVAATSAYGLPIVVGSDRAKVGAPGAAFMPGLFGPADQGGGPGSIWRIDGVTGEVKLFANVTLDGAPNSGPALGGLAIDPASNGLFVADRDTGMIHRFDLAGTETGRFDHGVAGRQAAGRPPVPFDPAKRLDVTQPAFKSEDPSTWAYAPAERRVFGLGVQDGRLYYAVADGLEIWSVGIAGSAFAGDPRLEIAVPPGDGPTEISKITFEGGRMIVAERPMPTGDYGFKALTQEGIGRVLRYSPPGAAAAGPEGPPGAEPAGQPGTGQPGPGQAPPGPGGPEGPAPAAPAGSAAGSPAGPPGQAQGDPQTPPSGEAPPPAGAAGPPVPDEYAIGFPLRLRNANGGVAVGYAYDSQGRIDRRTCGGFLWSTGEQLRVSADPALARQLASGGETVVDGLQGDGIELVRPANVPPLSTYFIDYDDRFERSDARGHMGDVAIYRVCDAGPDLPQFPVPPALPPVPPPPPLTCPPGSGLQPAFQCCPLGTAAGPDGACRRICPDGSTDPRAFRLCLFGFRPIPGPPRCFDGSIPRFNGAGGCPLPPGIACPAGFVRAPNPAAGGAGFPVCLPDPGQQACPPGAQIGLDGRCRNLCGPGALAYPVQQCCPLGSQVGPDGRCVLPPPPPPPPPPGCPPGSRILPSGICCPVGQIDRRGVCCPPGSVIGRDGICQPPPDPCPNGLPRDPRTGLCPVVCPPDSLPVAGGACCPRGQVAPGGRCCPPGSVVGRAGRCDVPPPPCPDGVPRDPRTGQCIVPCPEGRLRDPRTGQCVVPPCAYGQVRDQQTGQCGPPRCPEGRVRDPRTGQCVLPPCPNGQVRDPRSGQCVLPPCPYGQLRNPQTGQCGLPPCPEGRVRDPRTGQCVLPPCPNGQLRDPRSGQCGLPPCPYGQLRNPQTGQCGLPPCPYGQVRDQRTGRCAPPPCPYGQLRNPQTGQCGVPPCPYGQARDPRTGQCAPPPCSYGQTRDPRTGQCSPPPVSRQPPPPREAPPIERGPPNRNLPPRDVPPVVR